MTVKLRGEPENWRFNEVSLNGLANNFPEDAEVEYVDINRSNVAVVSPQENHRLILAHEPTGYIPNSFSAGTVDLDQIDIAKGPEGLAELTG